MLILITGGSASGKSEYAEKKAAELWYDKGGDGLLIYLAAMKRDSEESLRRIARHRRLREGSSFLTVECCRDYTETELVSLIEAEAAADNKITAQNKFPGSGRLTVLLECISSLTANEMFTGSCLTEDPFDAVMRDISCLRQLTSELVIVTAESGAGTGHYSAETEAYIKALGRINAALAAMADEVYEVRAGIPVLIK